MQIIIICLLIFLILSHCISWDIIVFFPPINCMYHRCNHIVFLSAVRRALASKEGRDDRCVSLSRSNFADPTTFRIVMINGADRKQIPMLDSNSHAKRVPAASSSPNRISGFLKNCTETARSRLALSIPMTCPKPSFRNPSRPSRRWLPNRIFECVMGRRTWPHPLSHSFSFRGAATGCRCLGAA